jgi:cytoskeletal protein CcmA (bactofilin family)
MAENPHRRSNDYDKGPPTVVSVGVEIVGDIRAPGAVMLCGSVKGDGDIGGALSIAKGAQWEGTLRAREAVVAGRLIGALTVEGKLEVGSQAVIQGRVSARTLAIADGAVIEGDILVTSNTPIMQYEEKRAADAPADAA